uniref:Fibroblast growth factor receptor 4-like n=1 Tax=Saccoglossus kowalevskii TaxID=10224 RepID=A0ABM0MYD7_SACKO|nr:PREDICTED: fibroblast growth factor receptor 4-like [Saccoglossus kowalevskii]
MHVSCLLLDASALSWTEDPRNTVAVHNTAVTLRCAFDGPQPNTHPQWRQINDPTTPWVVSRGANINTDECSTCSLSGNHGNGEFYLTINPVNVNTDEGLWECAAFGVDPSFKSATLTVLDAPTITLTDKITIIEGESLTVTCHVSSNPEATVTWEDSNGVKIKDDSLLEYTEIHRDDADKYTCIATNTLYTGVTERKSFTIIDVQYLPTVISKNTFAGEIGEPVVMNLTVDANPSLTTFSEWKNGNVTLSIKTDSSSSSVVYIDEVTEEYFGFYNITASNSVGEVIIQIQLVQRKCADNVSLRTGPPEPPKNIVIVETGYEQLTVEIIPGFDGGEPDNIVYYLQYGLENNMTYKPWPEDGGGSVNEILTITGLNVKTTYEFISHASNSFGNGDLSNIYRFKTYVLIWAMYNAWTLVDNCCFGLKKQDQGETPSNQADCRSLALKNSIHTNTSSAEYATIMPMEEISVKNDTGVYEDLHKEKPRNEIYMKLGEQIWEIPPDRLHFKEALHDDEERERFVADAWFVGGRDGVTRVEVERLKRHASQRMKDIFVNQICIMKTITPHPNILTLIGYSTVTEPPYFVQDYIGNNSLKYTLLKSAKNINDEKEDNVLVYALQIAEAMEHLETRDITLRNLCTETIIVGEGNICKISNMKYAVRNNTSTAVTNTFLQVGIQHRWKAVELFSDDNYSSKTDIWAFGVVLWEISTLGGEPYQGMSDDDVIRKIQAGYRMSKPEHCTSNMYLFHQS